jgi:hypothetical protein
MLNPSSGKNEPKQRNGVFRKRKVGRASGEPHQQIQIEELNRQDAKIAKGRGERKKKREKREEEIGFISILSLLDFPPLPLAILAPWRFNSSILGGWWGSPEARPTLRESTKPICRRTSRENTKPIPFEQVLGRSCYVHSEGTPGTRLFRESVRNFVHRGQ